MRIFLRYHLLYVIIVWNAKAVCDKFNVLGTFINGKCTQKLIIELFNRKFAVLASVIMSYTF